MKATKNRNIDKLYTPKQIQAMQCLNKDFWILLNHGAKRTGKTIVNNDMFLAELIRIRKVADKLGVMTPQYILAGNSLGTLGRNVLVELTNKYGITFKMDKFNRFTLFGVLVCCFGHGTVKDIDRIRGMTAYGAYINEVTTSVEEVTREILNRCSGEGARIIGDTNPDSPEHWIKKEWVDKADGNEIIAIHYELDDNTFLTQRYKDNVKRTTPQGQFYDRDILGLWVNAEGTVYSDFDKKTMVVNSYVHRDIIRYVAGVDWGYEHLGSICVIGIAKDGTYYLVEEHVKQYEEIDYWVSIASDIKKRYGNIPFFCDSARPEHVARFSREGFYTINANKEVLSGIEIVAKAMKQDKFRVLSKCTHFMVEIYNYVWNKKTGQPMKVHDDLMDAIRYAIYTDYRMNEPAHYVSQIKWSNYED